MPAPKRAAHQADPPPPPFDPQISPAEVDFLVDETHDETKPERQVIVRLDDEHLEALQRICAHERLKRNDALKRLIRLADQLISGEKSPFRSLDLEIHRKVG